MESCLVAVEGPYVFPIEVLTHKLLHKFYVIDSPSPFIAGFDLVVAAHLIINAVGRTVYTRSLSPTRTSLLHWTPFRCQQRTSPS